MASKNQTQVLIGGKIYTVSGYESEEYLQRVATFLNNKITEIKTLDGYSRMTPELKGLLLNLNTADEYFRLKKQADQLSQQVTAKDRELYEIKHELISAQMQLDEARKALSSEQEARADAEKRLAVLEERITQQPESIRRQTETVQATGQAGEKRNETDDKAPANP